MDDSRRGTYLLSISRGVAAFAAAFSLISLLGQFRSPPFDANLWWIDLRPIPASAQITLLATSAVLMLAWAIQCETGVIRRRVTAALLGLLLLATLLNSFRFFQAIARGQITSHFPLPFSLVVAGWLTIILRAVLKNARPLHSPRHYLYILATFALLAIALPLAQMFCFGNTDYRRPADVIVVLGAKVWRDGTPSDVLADRVRTACDLYHRGYAAHLIFSGGPSESPIDEPHAMRTLAERLGVPDSAITLDAAGLNTAATVGNSTAICRAMNWRRVLVVSHFYHLPRIKMAYQSQGADVWTVPAAQSNIPRSINYFLAREVAALWLYYVRAL